MNSTLRLSPNQYCVIATDSIKFNSIHTAPSKIIYVPGFRISTSADEIGIYDANDRKLYMASYAANEPGLGASNGKGFTLNYVDTIIDCQIYAPILTGNLFTFVLRKQSSIDKGNAIRS